MHRTRLSLCRLILPALLLSISLLAQHDRVVKGTVRPEARPLYDQGPLADDAQLTGILLMLKPSPDQQAALERLLTDQQDASSPDYHNWLTPRQYADRFGLSNSDIGRITTWLKDQGFGIGHVAQGRNWVLFSGTAAQAKKTFECEIRFYRVNGELHYANATEPSVPADLAPLVGTIMGLDDFRMKPPLRRLQPDFTGSDGSHYLAPGDIGVIYDINPLYAKNINGSGQKIAVMGQTRVSVADIESFRSQFGLPANDPQMILVAGSADPGITGDQAESDLDLEWSGAVAPNASILFVYSTNVLLSVAYAVDQNLAPVISYSYGECEPEVSATSAGNANAIRSVAQQANAQGQTWLASSGDQGAAACDSGKVPAKNGLAVNLAASVPEVTAVGGSEFNEGSGHYWNSTSAANGTSALSYIPEMAWNDTLSTGTLSSTGGGISIFFSKPAWQTGPGVPADGARDVPDISFTAANQHDPYIVVTGGQVELIGGTSVSTPVFAGVLALLNQYLVANGGKAGLGNVNPTLYGLAQNTPGIFHDITVGTNEVPCQIGTLNCNSGSMGYNTGVGYDLATGLGSADVYNLVTEWTSRPATGTTTTVTANPANILITSSTTATVTVKAASGTATPAGSVSFSVGGTLLGTANLSGTGGTATASANVPGILLSTGANTIKATYGGSTGFNSSSGSAAVTVSVPTASSAVIPSAAPNPVFQQQPDTNGNSWFPTVRLTEIAGIATSLNGFTINGQDYSSSIPGLFGSRSIPAHGTVSAFLAVGANVTLPGNVVFGFSGADLSGIQWSEQLTVSFYGPQLSAAMSLSSSPGTEQLNPKGDPNCDPMHPYYQELNLQELNGHEVYLTKFIAAGNYTSNNIQNPFNSWRLAPLGALQAGVCWQLTAPPPQTLNYEVDGTDDGGNAIKTTLSVVFQGAGGNVGALSVSKSSLALSVGPGQSTSTTLNVSVPNGQSWTLSVLPSSQNTRWLVVSPQSGTGSSMVNVTASAADLNIGGYTATLVFQSVNTIPQFVNVPVSLVAGGSAAMAINGVANGAAFNQTFAPGMILSVFGNNLTNSSTALYAPSVPLPFTLGGSTATVNGLPAPFYYASQTQLNIQVPYETPTGPALLAVINNGQVAAYPFTVSATAPGIFVGAANALVPVASATAGQVLSLFMTGEGDVSPPIATGATPLTSTPVNQLPAPRNAFSMKVGALPVTPQFIGIPYGLVGETQVNFAVPANTPLGLQNVVVTVGGNSSVAAQINVTQ
jgi:uncharacterized protein (TIGR03437 family)